MNKKTTHYMSTVKVGPKGQIVIPKEIREMFGIQPGDNLVIMADSKRGIAIREENFLTRVAEVILGGDGKTVYPDEKEEDLTAFAKAIKQAVDNGETEK